MKAVLPILIGASMALLAPLGAITPAAASHEAPGVRASDPLAVDCDAPTNPNQLLVCTDADLLQRDRALAALAAASPDQGALAQLEWLRAERDLCDSADCLRISYDAGIGALNEAAEARAS